MHTLKVTVRNRRIELAAPDEFPDGTEVFVELTPVAQEQIGMDEAEWRDDAEALADWDRWLATIEPIELTAEEQAANDSFAEAFRRYNIDAVRRQMSVEN